MLVDLSLIRRKPLQHVGRMSGVTTVERPSLRGFMDGVRTFFDRISAFVELNRSAFLAVQRLIEMLGRIGNVQLRLAAVAVQVLQIPIKIGQGSLQMLRLLQLTMSPVGDERMNGDSAGRVTTVMGQISRALLVPLKFIALPISILEAPFRSLTKPTTAPAAGPS